MVPEDNALERTAIPAMHTPLTLMILVPYPIACSTLLHVPVSEHIMITVPLVVFLGLLLSASCVLVSRFVLIHRLGHSGIARMAKVMFKP